VHFNYDTFRKVYTFPNVCPEKNVYYCIERHTINAYDLFNDILFYIFAMRRYKVKEVIRMLEDDGWYLVAKRGSHRQFKHSQKKGRVTVNEKPSATLDQEILNSIWKQAGWK